MIHLKRQEKCFPNPSPDSGLIRRNRSSMSGM